MNRTVHAMPLVFVLVFCIAIISCTKEPPSSPRVDSPSVSVEPQQIAQSIIALTGWPVESSGAASTNESPTLASAKAECRVGEREVIAGDVAHYRFVVRTGPGPFDEIGIHRVVRESSPNRPIRTPMNVLFLHGDIKDFEGVYLPGLISPRIPDDVGIAVYLAQNNVDVWGVDQAWCLVPESVTDLGFMSSWGMQRQVNDLAIGVAVARITRLLTGGGVGKIILGGFSSGASTGYAMLNQETILPPVLRNVGGFIPIDYGLKTDVPEWESVCCSEYDRFQNLIDAGECASYNPFLVFGPPALQDPDGISEVLPPYTNYQAALGIGGWPSYPGGVTYHLVAGIFDEEGTPVGLQYTPPDSWIDFMVYSPPWEPNAFMRDYSAACCPGREVPWDDRLGHVRVPILFIKAGGGAGYLGEHTLDLVGSSDITRLVVQLHSQDEVLLDFGHCDIFTSADAVPLIWQPMLSWISGHCGS